MGGGCLYCPVPLQHKLSKLNKMPVKRNQIDYLLTICQVNMLYYFRLPAFCIIYHNMSHIHELVLLSLITQIKKKKKSLIDYITICVYHSLKQLTSLVMSIDFIVKRNGNCDITLCHDFFV